MADRISISDLRKKYAEDGRQADAATEIALFHLEESADGNPEFLDGKTLSSLDKDVQRVESNVRKKLVPLIKEGLKKTIEAEVERRTNSSDVLKKAREEGERISIQNARKKAREELDQDVLNTTKKVEWDARKYFYASVTLVFGIELLRTLEPAIESTLPQLSSLIIDGVTGAFIVGAAYSFYKLARVCIENPQNAADPEPEQRKRIKIIVASTPEVKPLVSPAFTVEEVASAAAITTEKPTAPTPPVTPPVVSDKKPSFAKEESIVSNALKQKGAGKTFFVSSLLVGKTPLEESAEKIYQNGCTRSDNLGKKTETNPRLQL